MSLTKVTSQMIKGASGGGSKNYFNLSNVNGDFETNVISPWQTCSTTFTNGAPGSLSNLGSGSITLSLNSTTPLSGVYDLLATKPASNVQGHGFISGVITIDPEDLAKVFTLSFSYKASSNFDASGSSTQSLEVWIYNKNAGTWIQPAGYRGMNSITIPGKLSCTFQTDGLIANNQYQVAIFTNQTSTSAYTVNFDSFQMGPQVIGAGVLATDLSTYSLTIGAITTPPTPGAGATSLAQWRRDGDMLELTYTLSQATTGSAGSGEYLFPIPSQFTIDTTKAKVVAAASLAGGSFVGAGYATQTLTPNTGSTTTNLNVVPYDSKNLKLVGTGYSGSGGGYLVGSGYFSLSNVTYLTFTARVPIAGWSSNVQMSSDTDTRVVAAFAQSSNGATISTGDRINFNNVVSDTHGAITTGAGNTWQYRIPVSGWYEIDASAYVQANAQRNLSIVAGGTVYATGYSYTGGLSTARVSGTFPLKAGDLVWITSPLGSMTFDAVGAENTFSIKRVSGPSVIAASESVYASYYISSNLAVATTFVNFDTKVLDSHNAVTTGVGTWKFTVPVSGLYSVSTAGILAQSAGSSGEMVLYKNNANYRIMQATQPTGAYSSGSTIVKCNAGDILQVFYDSTITILGNGTGQVGTVSIYKIGN